VAPKHISQVCDELVCCVNMWISPLLFQQFRHYARIEELHEGKDMKTGERQGVVDRVSEKGLPRIMCNKS
jgi:hypothetical protein